MDVSDGLMDLIDLMDGWILAFVATTHCREGVDSTVSRVVLCSSRLFVPQCDRIDLI